jgi:hypothetical protein
MRVAVIGAGCSGITAVKNLLQAGIKDVICFEQNDQVGGNWIFTASESHSSVCETTHIISSKKMSEYMDFPMPAHYPDYPSHQQVLAYFQSYAAHFGLYPYIRFNTKVASVEKTPSGKWQLKLGDGSIETADYLFISNGHHSVPRHPQLPGAFSGRYLHAHQFKNNQPFKGERVLVIGAGNSGCDCAVEISRVATFTAISMRSPQYIIPKFFLGKPTDTFNAGMSRLPDFILGPLQQFSLRIQVGKYEDYGLPQPDFPVVRAHPTMNSELLYKIRHGAVHPRKGIRAIEGNMVTFSDGQTEPFDTIIAATGYKISLPFFDDDFINYEEAERIPLYLRMFHPQHPNLVFIGLVQPQGAVWPLSDYQAKLAANYVAGRWSLPADVANRAEQDANYIAKEFLKAKRHAVEVHFHPYLRRLQKEIPGNAPQWQLVRETVS